MAGGGSLPSIVQQVEVLFGGGTAAGLSDREVLGRYVASGDGAAFAAIVARHGPMVLGVCRRMLGDVTEADDAFQATFLVLVRKAASLRNRDLVGPWLYGVAHRVASRARRDAARRRAKQHTLTSEVDAVARAQTEDPAELKEVLDDEVNRLPERFRRPVVLCLVQGRSQEDAARELRLSPGAVRGRLARAKARLRERLLRRGVAPAVATAALGANWSEAQAAVPPALLAATLRTAADAGVAPVAALALMKGALHAMFLAKLKQVAAAVLLFGLVASGSVFVAVRSGRAARPTEDQENVAARGTAPAVRQDAEGDRLPDGALVRLGTHRFRHDHTIVSLSYAGNGRILASGSWDDTARIWDAATGRERRRFGGAVLISSVALSPDGTLLAVGGRLPDAIRGAPPGPVGGLVKVWDLDTGQEILTTGPLENTALCVSFSRDGSLLAASSGNVIRIWNVATWAEPKTILGPPEGVRPVAFTPDARLLMTRCDDSTVRIYETDTGREQRVLKGPGKGLIAFAIAPDGRTIATAGEDGTLRFWDITSGQEVRQFPAEVPTTGLTLSPDGRLLAHWGHNGRIHVRDAATGTLRFEARKDGLDQNWVLGVTFSPDGKTLAAGGEGKGIWFWDVATGLPLRAADGHRDALVNVAFVQGGRLVASAGRDSTVRLWDASTGRQALRWIAHQNGLQAMAVSPDGRRLATVGGDPLVRLWDAATGREIHALRGHREKEVNSVAFAPDGVLVASGSWPDRTVRLWDSVEGRLQRTIDLPRGEHGHNYGDLPLAFTPDGRTLATGSGDRTFLKTFLWDVSSGRLLHTLDAAAPSMAFSPDGTVLALACGQSVRLWDPNTGREVEALKGDPEAGHVLAFSPDGRTLAAGSGPAVHLWDPASGRVHGRIEGNGGVVSALALSPDGRFLAVGSEDTTVMVWDLMERKRGR
jgi:RNA polymerase sigma factor (sigma-70 family)